MVKINNKNTENSAKPDEGYQTEYQNVINVVAVVYLNQSLKLESISHPMQCFQCDL